MDSFRDLHNKHHSLCSHNGEVDITKSNISLLLPIAQDLTISRLMDTCSGVEEGSADKDKKKSKLVSNRFGGIPIQYK